METNWKKEFIEKVNEGLSNKELMEYFNIKIGTLYSRFYRCGIHHKKEINPLEKNNYKILNNFSNYGIKNDGTTINLKNNRIISQVPSRDGYLYIKLVNDQGKRVSLRLNRVVAILYVKNPNPNKFIEVNHKDRNIKNNNYLNLEWCSSKYNHNHALINGAYEKNKKYNNDIINDICKLLEIEKSNVKVASIISEKYSLDKNKIERTINNIKRKKCWKYISKNYNI